MADPFDKDEFKEFMQKEDVLLRAPETCKNCKKVFMSLYPLARCRYHDGLEAILSPFK